MTFVKVQFLGPQTYLNHWESEFLELCQNKPPSICHIQTSMSCIRIAPVQPEPRAILYGFGSSLMSLFNCHSTWNRGMGQIRHLCHVVLLLFTLLLPTNDMRFQTLIEIHRTCDRIDDSNDDKDQCDDCKCCNNLLDGNVIICLRPIVHSHELKDEVRKSRKVKELMNRYLAFDVKTFSLDFELTIIALIPILFSFLVKCAAISRIRIVIGIAAIVRPNSGSVVLTTLTTNCMVNPRKKKKSNLRRAM